MIEQALLEHLQAQSVLATYLSEYDGKPAVFSQEAPADTDLLWRDGSQYGRIVFAIDLQGDPERVMGGILAVDILCEKDKQYPEDIEPIIRQMIHGYFFSNGTFTVVAQWRNSDPFTEPTNRVIGCTVTFELLAFPILTTVDPDVVARMNEWMTEIESLHVINYDVMPSNAWRPQNGESAVYCRLVNDNPAGWIPDTYQTIWRTATMRIHIFSESNAMAGSVARFIVEKLYSDKRLLKTGESPIMVNRRNGIDFSADPMRTGQITVEATYGIIVATRKFNPLHHIYTSDERRDHGN